MRRLPFFAETPFFVSHQIFVNPKCRGFRLPQRTEDADPSQVFYKKPFRVHDARALAQAPSLEQMGFELVQAPIEIDFSDHELVVTRFYDYCAALVEAATGCRAAKTMQHEFRTGAPSGAGSYATMPHADVNPYIEDVLDAPEQRHFGIFNVWRSTDPLRNIETWPLALCDSSTVSSGDMVSTDGWRGTDPPTRMVYYLLIHSMDQCWYCFPRMGPGEAIIFRQYDTRKADPADRVTFHTAVTDPQTSQDAPPRKSIEARVLAVFAETRAPAHKTLLQAEVPTRRPDGTKSTWRYEKMVDWGSEGRYRPV